MLLDIISAITDKKRIEFTYKGDKRIVEPYLLGNNKSGELMLRGFEVSTQNSGLKLFKFSDMSGLKVTDTSFLFAHPTFRAKDSQIIKAVAVVS